MAETTKIKHVRDDGSVIFLWLETDGAGNIDVRSKKANLPDHDFRYEVSFENNRTIRCVDDGHYEVTP